MVYCGRNIPSTNIIDLLDDTLITYEAHIAEQRGFDLFTKGLADIGINKALIEIFVGKTTKRRTWNARNAE